jgi:adenine-specific DNA-methyltransferase
MLAEAVCKLEGFTYSPSSSQEEYWMHGRSTERDFIYVTTQHLSATQLQVISDDVGDERTLLVMCSAFDADPDGYPNLTVKKIPQSILHKCEWGKDDYSLRVSNLPMLDPSTEESLEAASEARGKGAQRRKKREAGMTPLFDADGEA